MPNFGPECCKKDDVTNEVKPFNYRMVLFHRYASIREERAHAVPCEGSSMQSLSKLELVKKQCSLITCLLSPCKGSREVACDQGGAGRVERNRAVAVVTLPQTFRALWIGHNHITAVCPGRACTSQPLAKSTGVWLCCLLG